MCPEVSPRGPVWRILAAAQMGRVLRPAEVAVAAGSVTAIWALPRAALIEQINGMHTTGHEKQCAPAQKGMIDEVKTPVMPCPDASQ